MPDIDIDFADRNDLLDKLKHRIAKLDNGKKHNTGVYFTEVPHDPATNISTLDYDTAENRKYFKIDCLNVSIYKDIKDEQHLVNLMNKEPVWELLEAKDFVDKIFHINGHSEILNKLKPRNIEQLAAVLAIIRPSALAHSSHRLAGYAPARRVRFTCPLEPSPCTSRTVPLRTTCECPPQHLRERHFNSGILVMRVVGFLWTEPYWHMSH